MKITLETVDYVANLARLSLTEEQKQKMLDDLDKILVYVDKLNEIDTSGVAPTAHILPVKNVFREDETEPSYDRTVILANAPVQEDGCFKVPKIVD
ncbi:MAG: Asp-tRNA(Asn)/Glu-tRNA(Gln) amidotransferase subunit GatC [Clostridia bacterium]